MDHKVLLLTLKQHNLSKIVGRTSIITKLREQIIRIGTSTLTPVLITGETGTGKELVADALHDVSHRHDRAFVKINCSAIPETLLESHLFGHMKGSFTSAVQDQIGLFEQADGGTILLDEIGDMSHSLQPKLLRFLETQSFHSVGNAREKRVDVRVLASTNSDLEEKVAGGSFREDLFFRLNGVHINIPPLRQRRPDIKLLMRHFIKESGHSAFLSQELEEHLKALPWPGNVRELKNLAGYLQIHASGSCYKIDDLPEKYQNSKFSVIATGRSYTLKEVEKQHILQIYNENGKAIRKTAAVLGIDRNTLKKKLGVYGSR
ncbi:sigma-54-dependent Fis family transcriptional regulator [bacterium]|nr:sigma-54-dependent Fis family transcriptional regulator [bacterium]